MDEHLQKKCENILARFVDAQGIGAAILATADGIPVAASLRLPMEPDASAAMSASLAALADSLLGQAAGESAKAKQVVLTSEAHTIALIHVGDNMVLAVVGDAGMNLGMTLARARAAAEEIMDAMARGNKAKQPTPSGARPSLDDLVQRVLREVAQKRGASAP